MYVLYMILPDYDPVWTDTWPQNKCRSLWPIFHGPVILCYILKTIWCMNIILGDYEAVWPDVWPENKCMSLWPIFHDPLILPQNKYKSTWPVFRVATGQGKVGGNLIFLQGQGKVREFCKLIREILNTKKVKEKSGNFIILAQNMCCSRYLTAWNVEKSDFLKVVVFTLAHSKPWKMVNFRTFCAKKLFKDFICFIWRIREVHFNELVKGICRSFIGCKKMNRS